MTRFSKQKYDVIRKHNRFVESNQRFIYLLKYKYN
jgi:hypothetical protein